MKNLETILKQTPVYLHNWNKKFDVIASFEDVNLSESEYYAEEAPFANIEYWEEAKVKMKNAMETWQSINILFASYGTDNYSGDSFVLFEKEGKLFEAHGSHCSCYGLEGQFDPEETVLETFKNRLIKGTLGRDDWSGNEFADELMYFLGIEDDSKQQNP